jgi:hypothetical protein
MLGSIASVMVAYGQLVWLTVIGKHPYDRVWQMTLGFATMWASLLLGSIVSIVYVQDVSYEVIVARYLAFIAACLQVTAPDFGLGIFHGRDRKTLWVCTVTGLIVSALIMVSTRL